MTPMKRATAVPALKHKQRFSEVLFYCLFFVASAVFVYLRGQDRNWDLLNYHFYQGYALFTGRLSIDLAAAGLQTFLNPLINLFSYLSLAYLPFPLNAWSILAVQLASVPAVVLLAKEVGASLGYSKAFIPAIPAVILCLLSPMWGSELGTTFFSSWTAPLIVWGVYFLYTAYQTSGTSWSRVILAGVLIGLATGLKLTNAPFAISGLSMVLVFYCRSDWRRVLSGSVYFIAGCGAGFALTAWWNWYLWSTWDSPLFPLYNAIFKSEYHDFVNFRDMRWHFASVEDFFSFLVNSFFGTTKTSENLFADARYLLAALLLPAAALCRPAVVLNRQLLAFVVFIFTSFLLWLFMFAYQRYLIPLELLLGLLIWILVARLFEKELLRKVAMICALFCAAWMIKVPDWGHAPIAFGEKNPFSIEMDARLSATPGRYIVVGDPISYVLPSLHPDSTFHGVGFSRKIDDLVFRKLAEPSTLPLRILALDDDAALIPQNLQGAGYDSHKHSLACNYFKTGIGRYVVCEVQPKEKAQVEGYVAVDADYSAEGYLTSKGVLWERGLSASEPWGRWSDGARVEFGLADCLPQGRLTLTITGHALGPNVGRPIKFVSGDAVVSLVFTDSQTRQSASFVNAAECINKVDIIVPKPASPQELGLSADPRKLGLGLVNMKIVKE